MKHRLFATGTAVMLALAVAAAAQAPSTPSSSMNQSLTMTGCVKSTSDLTSSGTQNPPSASWPPGQFVLTNATAATSGREGTRDGRTSPGPASPVNRMPMPPISQYLLRPADSAVNLSSHVNQKVEVTARLAPSTSPQAPTAGPVPSSSQGTMSSVPTLAVTSIRQVSATCG